MTSRLTTFPWAHSMDGDAQLCEWIAQQFTAHHHMLFWQFLCIQRMMASHAVTRGHMNLHAWRVMYVSMHMYQ